MVVVERRILYELKIISTMPGRDIKRLGIISNAIKSNPVMSQYLNEGVNFIKINQDMVMSYENNSLLQEGVEFNFKQGPEIVGLHHFFMEDPLYVRGGTAVHTYLTSWASSQVNANYARGVLVNPFEGVSKVTCGLETYPHHFSSINSNYNTSLGQGHC
jgi:hypothetical protein